MDKAVSCISHGASFCEAVSYRIVDKYVDDSGRFIVLSSLNDNTHLGFMNYYAPNEETDQLKVFDNLNIYLDDTEVTRDTALIWRDDFNLIFDVILDVDGGSENYLFAI